MRCPKRPGCFDKAGIRRRVLASSCYPAFFRGHQRVGTPEYLAMMRLRKIWAEGSFSVLKREHCISRIRKRGILAATEECLLAAMALNLKRVVNAIFRYLRIYCSAGNTVGFQQNFCFCQQVPYCTLSHTAVNLQTISSKSLDISRTCSAGSFPCEGIHLFQFHDCFILNSPYGAGGDFQLCGTFFLGAVFKVEQLKQLRMAGFQE